MKNRLLLALLTFWSLSALAQDKIIFKGTTTLPNTKEKEVVVKDRGQTIAAFPVKDDNTFYGEVPLKAMKQLVVNHGTCGQPVFAKPGREVTIHFGDRPMTATFSGSPETELYIDMRFLIHPLTPGVMWHMSWPAYKLYNEQSLEAKLKYGEVFTQLHGDIEPSYFREVQDYTKYSLWGSLITWPRFHMQSTNKTVFEEEEDWQETLEAHFAKIEWDRPELCGLPNFVSFAEYHFNEEAKKKTGSGDSFILGAFDAIRGKIDNRQVREFFFHHFLNKYLKNEPASTRDAVIAAYKSEVTNERLLGQLDDILASAARFGSDAPAFDFALEDINGKQVRLSDFRGKVVYLDFWATWCGPCLAEIPHLNKLKLTLKDNKDIVVIGISTDEVRDKEKWKVKLDEMGMEGYQLFAGENAAEVKKHYNVRGIPHFVMIDKEGKIYQNATIRPSNPQTISVLRDLVKQ